MRNPTLAPESHYDVIALDYKGTVSSKQFGVTGAEVRRMIDTNEREKLGDEIRWYTPYKFKYVK